MRTLLAGAAPLLLLAACNKATCPASPPPTDDLCGSGFYVKFDDKSATDYGGDFGMLLDTLDGFGTYAPVLVQFNDLIDPVSLPQTAAASIDPATPVFLVDLEAIRGDPKAPWSAVVQPLTAWYNSVQ